MKFITKVFKKKEKLGFCVSYLYRCGARTKWENLGKCGEDIWD